MTKMPKLSGLENALSIPFFPVFNRKKRILLSTNYCQRTGGKITVELEWIG